MKISRSCKIITPQNTILFRFPFENYALRFMSKPTCQALRNFLLSRISHGSVQISTRYFPLKAITESAGTCSLFKSDSVKNECYLVPARWQRILEFDSTDQSVCNFLFFFHCHARCAYSLYFSSGRI